MTNREVMHQMDTETDIILNIKRKLEYLGQIIRGQKYTLIQNIIQGKMERRRNPSHRRMKNLKEWFG